jgi:hypothetical protein
MNNPEEGERGEIELLAYSYWEQRGCPEDGGEEDWLRAEEDLRSGRVLPRRERQASES